MGDRAQGAEIPRGIFILLMLLAAFGALGGGFAIANAITDSPPERVVEVRVSPPVLESVRELARLETVSFHMQRVVELKEEQRRGFGLIAAEDAILLVAAANVSAGVDLSGLREADIEINEAERKVKIRLPQASIFNVALDEDHTYVHSRSTDWMAKRNIHLESEARKRALSELSVAAERAGIIGRAEVGAKKTLESLVRSLGYSSVEVSFSR